MGRKHKRKIQAMNEEIIEESESSNELTENNVNNQILPCVENPQVIIEEKIQELEVDTIVKPSIVLNEIVKETESKIEEVKIPVTIVNKKIVNHKPKINVPIMSKIRGHRTRPTGNKIGYKFTISSK